MGPLWPTVLLPPGGVYRELRSGEIIAVTVPLLMRGGGNPSKAAYASLEVLVSSVAALAVIQGLP